VKRRQPEVSKNRSWIELFFERDLKPERPESYPRRFSGRGIALPETLP
jgi:hypothetical protein